MSSGRTTLVQIAKDLRDEIESLRFGPPVTHVYNPLAYAWKAHEQYLRRYGTGKREVLLVGMNPGPWGMAQTGVPFGEVASVREWLGISAGVERPDPEHPKRRIDGFACQRSEVSGQRLWGWARERFGTAERFFRRFFVWNYCPLCFMEESGRNRTPDKLPKAQREPLFAACDEALRRVADVLAPRVAVGIGAFAEQRLRTALAGSDCQIGRILHPSPASPLANRGWAQQVDRELEALLGEAQDSASDA